MYSFYHDISSLSQNNIASAVAESAISNISSSAVQSAVNGDSFSEALENQVENTLIGAQEIGSEFKNGNISRAKQLTLHSALGCGTALAGGGDCATGAVSGVTGELAGEYFKDNLYPDQTTASLTEQQKTVIKELGGLAGGLSSIFTGNAVGLSESEIADNIFSGQRIGKNAVENNFFRQEIREEQQEIMWLEGKISDEEYNAFKNQELKNAVLGAELLAGMSTLGSGAAVTQGGKTIIKSSLTAKATSAGKALNNIGKKEIKSKKIYSPDRKIPRTKNGDPTPDSKYPHTQLGKRNDYRQGREWGYSKDNGNLVPKKDIDFTNHGTPRIHPSPHQHRLTPNNPRTSPKGGFKRGKPEPLQ